ncbi:MAG: deoxyribonuclease IV [Candidatus Omnitrophica bacterium]|nr:deoxyribonuclease IV [Candidatus Omnitrophota bacterium]
MYLGVHVSASGKIYEAVDRAASLGCTAMQIFSRNPRQWRQGGVCEEDSHEFRHRLRSSGIRVVAVHIPYLINLATSYDVLYKKSIEGYIEDMRETDMLGAQYLVTHMGSFKNSTLADGLGSFIKALNIIFRQTKDLKGVKLLLENTSGSGSWLGSTFDHHKIIFDAVEDRSRLGLCLDTAHAFAAGYDIRRPEVFDALIDEVDAKVGKGALHLVHLNDSASDCGTHIDRHDHIGKGFIGTKAFRHIVNHPGLKDAAFILETPKDTPRSDKMNLNRVRKLAG